MGEKALQSEELASFGKYFDSVPTQFRLYSLLINRQFVSCMQLFPRQEIEDGSDPISNCAPNRTELDPVELDDENHAAIPPFAPGGNPGKSHARSSIRDWSDDDSEDCVMLEVHDIEPLSFAYPMPSTSADRKSVV